LLRETNVDTVRSGCSAPGTGSAQHLLAEF
jgi:hypothetical protein